MTPARSTRLAELIQQLSPALDPMPYRFVCQSDPPTEEQLAICQGLLREAEGLTLILPAEKASDGNRYRRITLTVPSSLEDVGLTAAVSSALAEAGIAANLMAGVHHDHLYVPAAQASRAMTVLDSLSREHQAGTGSTQGVP